MPSYKLQQVFGVHSEPPRLTYVDRGGLDDRIHELIGVGRHLIIYGPSKQGKSALRKHEIPDHECVTVQCRGIHSCDDIYGDILNQLGIHVITGKHVADGRKLNTGVEAGGGIAVKFLAKGEAKAHGGIESSRSETIKSRPIGEGPGNLRWVAENIREAGKRIIIEDFHYIPEVNKKAFALDLKTLFEFNVPLVLIGVWEQPHLFIAYNGDLDGRIEEIYLKWTDAELFDVLKRGEEALNVSFSPHIKREIVRDASGNVGLVQRVAERLCLDAGITETAKGDVKPIEDEALLNKARQHICEQVTVRYSKFASSIAAGFAKSKPKIKQTYLAIIRAYVTSTPLELLAGISETELLRKVAEINSEIPEKRVTTLLRYMDRLQREQQIEPIVVSFDPSKKVLSLADRHLIFFLKYGNPVWPWELENGE